MTLTPTIPEPRRTCPEYDDRNDPLHPLVMRLRARLNVVMAALDALVEGTPDTATPLQGARASHLLALRARWNWADWAVELVPLETLAEWERSTPPLDISATVEKIEQLVGFNADEWVIYLAAVAELSNEPLSEEILTTIDRVWEDAKTHHPQSLYRFNTDIARSVLTSLHTREAKARLATKIDAYANAYADTYAEQHRKAPC